MNISRIVTPGQKSLTLMIVLDKDLQAAVSYLINDGPLKTNSVLLEILFLSPNALPGQIFLTVLIFCLYVMVSDFVGLWISCACVCVCVCASHDISLFLIFLLFILLYLGLFSYFFLSSLLVLFVARWPLIKIVLFFFFFFSFWNPEHPCSWV